MDPWGIVAIVALVIIAIVVALALGGRFKGAIRIPGFGFDGDAEGRTPTPPAGDARLTKAKAETGSIDVAAAGNAKAKDVTAHKDVTLQAGLRERPKE